MHQFIQPKHIAVAVCTDTKKGMAKAIPFRSIIFFFSYASWPITLFRLLNSYNG